MAKFRQYESGISVVWTESKDIAAFCELVIEQHARQSCAMALIYYSSGAFNPHQLVDYFSIHCSDLNYCGCSTGGEISPDGMQECGALAILLPASCFNVLSQPIENIHNVGMNNIAQQAAQQRILFETGCEANHIESTFAITLIDGLTYSEESVTAALHRGLGDIPLIGGSAGDSLNFKKTTQLCNGRVYTNAAVLILINSNLPFTLCTENNFVPTDHKLVVTDADPDTRTVYEFNAEPAALAYAEAVGVDRDELGPQCFASNAMVVRVGGQYYCRAVQRVNRDDSLTFFSAIDTGVVLTIAKTEGMVHSMQGSIENIEHTIGKIDLMMGFECILRKLDARHRNVIERIEDVYRDNNIVAFNSYGEQYQAMHINQTFTGVAFGLPQLHSEFQS